MTINAEIPSRVAAIVRDWLTERFQDEFVFDPIIVEPEVDHDGDEYLKIYVVFDGDQKSLDPGWTLGLSRRIRPELLEMGPRLHGPGLESAPTVGAPEKAPERESPSSLPFFLQAGEAAAGEAAIESKSLENIHICARMPLQQLAKAPFQLSACGQCVTKDGPMGCEINEQR